MATQEGDHRSLDKQWGDIYEQPGHRREETRDGGSIHREVADISPDGQAILDQHTLQQDGRLAQRAPLPGEPTSPQPDRTVHRRGPNANDGWTQLPQNEWPPLPTSDATQPKK